MKNKKIQSIVNNKNIQFKLMMKEVFDIKLKSTKDIGEALSRKDSPIYSFIGDTILSSSFMEFWLDEYPLENDVGKITKMKDKICSNRALAEFYEYLSLKDYVSFNSPEEYSKIQGDIVESLFALIYKHCGLLTVKRFIKQEYFMKIIPKLEKMTILHNYKGMYLDFLNKHRISKYPIFTKLSENPWNIELIDPISNKKFKGEGLLVHDVENKICRAVLKFHKCNLKDALYNF